MFTVHPFVLISNTLENLHLFRPEMEISEMCTHFRQVYLASHCINVLICSFAISILFPSLPTRLWEVSVEKAVSLVVKSPPKRHFTHSDENGRKKMSLVTRVGSS